MRGCFGDFQLDLAPGVDTHQRLPSNDMALGHVTGTVEQGRRVAGEEFTNRCLDSMLNQSGNKLRNNFPAARPRSKQRNCCLESWYSSIVS
jgi:hypothetical protein